MDENKEIIAERLLSLGATPDMCYEMAVRSALRTLPLLILYSETEHKVELPIVPFGFWPASKRKHYLRTMLRAHGLSLLITYGNFSSAEIFSIENNWFSSVQKTINLAKEDAEIACEIAKSQLKLFSSHARGSAFLSTHYLVYRMTESLTFSFRALDRKYGELWHVDSSAKHLVYFSTAAANHYREAVVAAKKYISAHDFSAERTDAINAAYKAAAHLAKRFARCAECVADEVTTANQNTDLLAMINAAKIASAAFNSVANDAAEANVENFSTAVPAAISAAQVYEQARVIALPGCGEIGIDLYVDVDTKSYELVELLQSDGLIHGAIAKLIANTETMASSFASANAENYNSVKNEFDLFYQSYKEIDEYLPIVANIFDPAKEAARRFFEELECHEKKLEEFCAFTSEAFDQELYSLTLDTIEHADSVCRADTSAYSSHDTRHIKTLFRYSVLADLDFLSSSTANYLQTQDIWPLKHLNSVDDCTDNEDDLLKAKAVWEDMWEAFKQDASAIEPALGSLLDFFDDVFAGKDIDIQRLEKLLMAEFDVAMVDKF